MSDKTDLIFPTTSLHLTTGYDLHVWGHFSILLPEGTGDFFSAFPVICTFYDEETKVQAGKEGRRQAINYNHVVSFTESEAMLYSGVHEDLLKALQRTNKVLGDPK